MTLDVNDKVRIHTNGGIELNEPSGGWNFGSLAGGNVEEEAIASNGGGLPPKWLRFTTFQELDYATLRSKSDKLLAGGQLIGSSDTKLIDITTESGLDRHLIAATMVFSVESITYGQVRPRVFLTPIRSRFGPSDTAAAYQAICFSTTGEMQGCQMSVTVYTTANTPGNRAPLNVQLMGRLQDAGATINAVDGSMTILSWNDPD